MIEKLEISKLKKYKFASDSIERLITWDKYEMYLLNDKGVFWASNIANAIYSGTDGERKFYFRQDGVHFPQKNLNLVPEYYTLKETLYIEKQKKIAGTLFNKISAQQDFKNFEIAEVQELITAVKAHNMYERLASKKEYVEKLNWYLKWLTALDFKDMGDDRINWIELFNSIDVDKKLTSKVYKTNSIADRENYFSKASFSTTIELIQNFKKQIYLLSHKRKLAYINGLNIVPPTMGKSESEVFNQTVFEARYNFYDFLLSYKRELEGKLTPEKARVRNEVNKIDLLHNRLSAVAYFAPIEDSSVKIPMFTMTSNEEFREIVKQELSEIRQAEAEGNKRVTNPYKSRDIMALERVFETSRSNLILLLNDKFANAKLLGFKTLAVFAKHELQQLDRHYKASMGWFPLFDQWKDFLKEISHTGTLPTPKKISQLSAKSDAKSKKQQFSLRQIAIAYSVMGVLIDKDKAPGILKKYSTYTSGAKLVQKRINKLKTLTVASDNKTTNTKHLKDLTEAKRLISGTKNAKAKIEIARIIQEFEAAYQLKR